jgi:N-acetyl-anhydromuramyl-L-alanine amidase AmpD
MMGVECVSRGLEPDFTQAMKKTLARLAVAMKVACDWPDTSTLRLPRHRDYAPSRKIDIQHSNNEVQEWIRLETEAWDGKVPDIEGIYNAEKDPNLRNPAAWRLAARLFDLGYGDYPQPKTKQGYPRKAMILYNKEFGPNMEDKSKYGPKAHERIFGL